MEVGEGERAIYCSAKSAIEPCKARGLFDVELQNKYKDYMVN